MREEPLRRRSSYRKAFGARSVATVMTTFGRPRMSADRWVRFSVAICEPRKD